MSASNYVIKELIDNVDKFKDGTFALHEKKLLESIHKGQKPGVLIITCADSRIVLPSLFGGDPEKLFVIRNIGNIIPLYKQDSPTNNTSVMAGVEYAINILGIKDIIVMGHSHCGAMQAIYDNSDLKNLPGLKKWLQNDPSLYKKAAQIKKNPGLSKQEGLEILEKYNIILQIKHLKSYPIVNNSLKNNNLSIHSWFYQMHTGSILHYDPKHHTYKTLSKKYLAHR